LAAEVKLENSEPNNTELKIDKPVVLIVDDSPANIQVLAACLKDLYHIKVAISGQQCLDRALMQPKPDIILLDIEMPIMDGYKVCTHLKENPETNSIPVVFVTAKTAVEDEEKGLLIGAVDFITKPVRPAIVAARVRTHIALKQQHDKLADSEARLQAILDYSPILISTKDLNGNYTIVNRQYAVLEGLDPEAYIGKNIYDLFAFEVADALWKNDISSRSGILKAEEVFQHKDGSTHTYLSTKFPLINKKGEVVETGSISTDVTELKKAEMALRQAQKMDAVGHLTGGIAHDFNNILAVILGNLEILDMDVALDGDVNERIEDMREAVERAMDLTKQLLSFSRRKAKKVEVTDVRIVIQGMNKLISRSLTQAIHFEEHYDGDLWLTEIDSGDLQDALLNLINNARDAMSINGRVTIEAKNSVLDREFCQHRPGLDPGNYVQIIVSDNGEGIPAEVKENIFEPFFTTKPAGKGTGLGLAMVFGFVHRSRGHIEVYSEMGLGTSFKIYLPQSQSSELQNTPQKRMKKQLPRGDETVLVVDDEPGLLKLATAILESLGYRVLTAENGVAALARLNEHDSISLLFSDVVMPDGVNGYQLADIAIDRYPELKILLTSGYSEKALEINGESQFNANLLSKPYTRSELAKRVREVLDNRI